MWRRIRSLIVKEFLTLWKDRKSRFVLVVPPIIQLLLFANAATFEVREVDVGIWQEDRAALATELLQRFEGAGNTFRVVRRYDNPRAVEDDIAAQRVKAVLHVGQDFSADLLAGRPARLQLLLDGRRSNAALIVQNYAAQIVERFNRERALSASRGASVNVETRAWFNPNYDSRWFILPGLTVLLTMVATLLITALSVARERELGTFDQLLVTPLRPLEILVGKTVPALVIGFVEANVIAAVTVLAFGVPFAGQVALFWVGIVLFVLAAIGVGLVISSLARTQQQAILGVFLLMSPATVLSGFTTPIANMPDWCQALTRANPLRYMMELSRGVFLQDLGWSLAWPQLWPMIVIAAVTLSYATWLFGRKLA
ncbi:MAG: ABC transporter permease [Proteobacteria bacterium]|nr:ABC transporter permease [Pseudomonadota bacterium]